VLAWLKSNYDSVKQNLSTELTRYQNKQMLEAIVAGCAMVAYADGSVSAPEKQKMMGFLRTSETLKVFDAGEVIRLFEKYVEKFDFDHTIGVGEVMTAVAKFKGKPAEAQLIVRVCIAVSASDGTFDANERSMVRRLCQELDLDPQVFDL
jgi:tellurite resistance protein TerB